MRRVSLALLIPAVLAFAACEGGDNSIVGRDSVTTPPNPPSGVVLAENFRFRPGTLSITAGQSVTWTNVSSAVHDITADDGSFSSGTLAVANGDLPGESFVMQFQTAGTYNYHCSLHPQMTGTVVVQ